ncbi:MAG: EFR1 family ferrodoxin [Lachnospiraceae bacterium]|nr:EFR1 family ferrodoxin [Lachnospiraceae bacterium]
MTGIYFSGTGNTRHCIEKFIQEFSILSQPRAFSGKQSASSKRTAQTPVVSIEESSPAAKALQDAQDIIVLAYPVYYSNLPKIMRDFIVENKDAWKGKKVYILCTMGLFSGDGTGVSARLLRKYGASVIGGLHLIMPDSICDVKILKYPPEKNRQIIAKADRKLEKAARKMAVGSPTREGLGFFSHLAGFFGQRLWFYRKTLHYSDKLKINPDACIRCGRCVGLCPMHNLSLSGNKITAGGSCTMCYRCISQCPVKAITLIGKKVI